MSTADFTCSTGAYIPVDLDVIRRRQRIQPPAPPRTIAACRQALVDCAALHHLLVPNMIADAATLPIDTGHGPTLQVDGFHIRSENGRVRLAFIPGVLSGTYIVAPFGGSGFMSLGVQLGRGRLQARPGRGPDLDAD